MLSPPVHGARSAFLHGGMVVPMLSCRPGAGGPAWLTQRPHAFRTDFPPRGPAGEGPGAGQAGPTPRLLWIPTLSCIGKGLQVRQRNTETYRESPADRPVRARRDGSGGGVAVVPRPPSRGRFTGTLPLLYRSRPGLQVRACRTRGAAVQRGRGRDQDKKSTFLPDPI